MFRLKKLHIAYWTSQFTKFYDVEDLPNQGQKTMARFFVERWIVRFCFPINRHSDQILKILLTSFRSLCNDQGIQRTAPTSYTPIRGRYDWTVEECLSKYIDQNENE